MGRRPDDGRPDDDEAISNTLSSADDLRSAELITICCGKELFSLAKARENGSISTTCGYFPPLYTNHYRSSISTTFQLILIGESYVFVCTKDCIINYNIYELCVLAPKTVNTTLNHCH